MLDGEKSKLCTEVNDLQTRVAKDEEREEENRKENFGLKQKVSCKTVKLLGLSQVINCSVP